MKKAATYLCRVTDTLYNGDAHWVTVKVQIQNKLSLKAVTARTLLVAEGADATMTVKASATTTKGIKYQWYALLPSYEGAPYDNFTWQAIPGATKTSFTQTGVTEAIEFMCDATDKYGNTKSVSFLVGVDNGFTVASSDGVTSYTIFKGTDLTLSVDLAINDDTDLQTGWEYLYPNGSNSFWVDLEQDGCSLSGTDIDEDFTVRFRAMDRYSLIHTIISFSPRLAQA